MKPSSIPALVSEDLTMIEATEAGDDPFGAPTRMGQSARADLADTLVDAIRDKGSAMHAIARHAVGIDDAADVVQQTLMRLVARPDSFDPSRGSLGNFLLVLTHGVAVDHIRQTARRRVREQRSGLLAGAGPGDDSDAIVDRLARSRIEAALAELNIDERRLVVHSFFGGMSHRQIAAHTGLPEGTVKSRIRRALVRLRPHLLDLHDTDDTHDTHDTHDMHHVEEICASRQLPVEADRRAESGDLWVDSVGEGYQMRMDEVGMPAAPAISFGFGHDLDAPRRARQAVQSMFGDERGSFTEGVRLAASELVTNVILHTGDGGELRAYELLTGGMVRIEVEDHEQAPPVQLDPTRDQANGRGLRIIANVSDRWGVLGLPQGKVVWAEFQRPLG